MQRLARGRISDDVLSADHDLAVPLLAQRSRILMMHAHRSLPLFGQVGVIQHQDAIGRAALYQEAHALFIQGLRIPGGIRQQMLQLFQRGVGHRLGNRLTVLARQIGQQSGDVALQGAAAGAASKQWRKWLQIRRKFWQGIRRSLWQGDRLHLAIVSRN
jgi:hypothetical protein